MSALKKRLHNNGKVAFTIFWFKFYFGSVVGCPTREGTTDNSYNRNEKKWLFQRQSNNNTIP